MNRLQKETMPTVASLMDRVRNLDRRHIKSTWGVVSITSGEWEAIKQEMGLRSDAPLMTCCGWQLSVDR